MVDALKLNTLQENEMDAPEQFVQHLEMSNFIDDLLAIYLQKALILGRFAEMKEALYSH